MKIIDRIDNRIEKLGQIQWYRYLNIGMLAVMLLQFLAVVYVNLFQMRYHMGYDVSSYMIKAIEVWKQKTLFVDFWQHQTTLYIDNAMPIAALLYGISGDIFISYGIANIIVTLLLLLVFASICKELGLQKTAGLICMNLFLCPFLMESLNNWNDLGYFSMMFTSMASYGVKSLTVLMIVKTTLNLEREKANRGLLVAASFLSFIAGLSSGFYVAVTVMVPCGLYIMTRLLIKNNIRAIWNKQTAYVIGNGALLFLGKMISEKVIHFVSSDSDMVWVSLEQFVKNLASIFVGFLQLMQALPQDAGMEILNRHGVIYLFPFFIVMVCLLAFVSVLVQVCRRYEEPGQALLLIYVVVFNVFLFSIVYTTYGGRIFEERYLIELFLMIILLVGIFLNSLNDNLIFKGLLVLGLIGSIVIIDVKSDYTYMTTLNNYNELKEITEKVSELDSPVVYLIGDDIMCEQRNLRPIDTTKVYKSFNETGSVHHYGDYTYYDENGEYSGGTIMITTEESYPKIPGYIIDKYTYYDEVGKYKIYTSDENIIDNMAGITRFPVSVDYPYTPEVETQNGTLQENGTFLTDGTEGCVFQSEPADVVEGTYDITVNYEITESSAKEPARFEIVLGDTTKLTEVLDVGSGKKEIKNVSFRTEDTVSQMMYRITEAQGTKIRIASIQFVRKEGK